MLREPISGIAATIAASLALFAGTATAQVPEGWIVVSAHEVDFGAAALYTGSGGLFVANPSDPTECLPITGLPPGVVGAGSPALTAGTGGVTLDPSTGDLYVDDFGSTLSGSLNIHQVRLTNLQVSSVTSFPVATTVSSQAGPIGLGVPDTALLPDGRLAFLLDPASAGTGSDVMAGEILGIVDPTALPGSASSVTPLLVTPRPPGTPLSLAINDAGTTVFLATYSAAQGTSAITSLPVSGGSASTLLSDVAGAITGIDLRGPNELAFCIDGPNKIESLDLTSLARTVLSTVPGGGATGVRGLDVERISGDIYFMRDSGPSLLTGVQPTLFRRTSIGALIQLSSGPMGGWASPTGLTVNEALDRFGTPTNGTSSFDFVLDPSPGGAPRLGSSSSITIQSSGAAPALSLLIVSLSPLPTPLVTFGVEILVDTSPTSLVLLTAIPTQVTTTVPVPIPANPAFVGLSFYAQSFHFNQDLTTSTSPGLRATIQP